MSRDCSLAFPDKHLVVPYNLRSRASVIHVYMEREALDLRDQLETCRSELNSIFRQLEEADGRVAGSQQYQHELEEQLAEEKLQCRLRVLKAKKKVRDRAKRNIDQFRIERRKSEFQHALEEEDRQIAALREQWEGPTRPAKQYL